MTTEEEGINVPVREEVHGIKPNSTKMSLKPFILKPAVNKHYTNINNPELPSIKQFLCSHSYDPVLLIMMKLNYP